MIIKRNSFADKEDIDNGVRKQGVGFYNSTELNRTRLEFVEATRIIIQAERREFLAKAREKFAGMGAGVMHSEIMIKVVFVIDKLLEVNDG